MKEIIYGLSLLLEFFSGSSFAEEATHNLDMHVFDADTSQIRLVISPTLPDYIFEIGFSLNDKSGLTSEKPISVRRDGAPAVIQILRSTDDRPYQYNMGMGLCAALDLNLDGYQDLYFRTGALGDRSMGGDYFLFNPKTGLFDFQGNFPQLHLEPKNHRIYSQVNFSYRTYYEVIKGRLTNTMVVRIEEETNMETFKRITEVKRHGKWKVIKREMIRASDNLW